MKRKIFLALPLALMLGSCSIYKSYESCDEVNLSLCAHNDTLAVDTTQSIAEISWREFFSDPKLVALIDTALTCNVDLKSAQLTVEQAEATLKQARLSYLPSFAFSPSGTLSMFDFGDASKIYNIPVVAEWQVDIFASIRNKKRRAAALLEQSRDYEQAVRSQLIAQVANAYFTLQMLDAQLDISLSTQESWHATVETMRALMDIGMATDAATAQMEATYHSIGNSVCDLRLQIHEVEDALALMLHKEPFEIERSPYVTDTTEITLSVGVPLDLLSNRPDVRQAEHAVEAAFYDVNSARSTFYPSLTLSGSAGWTNNVGDVIVNPGKILLAATASLVEPIFAQGSRRMALKIAKAQMEQYQLQFAQTLLQAGSEVNDALMEYQIASAKQRGYKLQVAALERAYESTRLLMEHTTTNYLEVLTARQSLLSAQLQEVANGLAKQQSIINLYLALGGGSKD